MAKLPPLPIGVPPGHSYWNDWYEKLRHLINDTLTGTYAPFSHVGAIGVAEHGVFTSAEAGFAPASGGGTTNFLRADGSWEPAADPWTYVYLSGDVSTAATTATDVTGLSFTPAANKTYIVEGMLLLRSNDTTKGPRPSLSFPTGVNDSAYVLEAAEASPVSHARLNSNAAYGAGNAASTGLPNTTGSWPANIRATFLTGASPSGDFKVQVASE